MESAPAARGLGIRTFVRSEGGYTTLAVAVSLLVSVALVFALATAHWSMGRSADVQEVADASAMAGTNCVAAYSTVAQTLDACVLTMGLTGVVVCGAGLVVAAIPPLAAKSAAIMDAGRKILETRSRFATSAEKGISKLETALPALVMANSASCVAANSSANVRYVGMAVPFPQESHSDFSFLKDGLNADDMQDQSEALAEASKRKEEAHERAQKAKERAWRADNVDNPMCMQSRARTLAGLGGSLNPVYGSPDVWEFEYARIRAYNYYVQRYAIDGPTGGSVDEMQRSAARVQYYDYAAEAIEKMSCVDTPDEVRMDLEVLPHNTSMIRETRLYTDVVWPCTFEEELGSVLHCSLDCPGATGPYDGDAALQSIDAGLVLRCDVCKMDAHAMGNVASASTNIDNGFEHYWRIVVEASREYEDARRDEIAAEKEMKKAAEKGRSAFDEAIDLLNAPRPKLCPPGAWGCVSVVARSQTSTPASLANGFSSGGTIASGAAVAGATLAPDESTAHNTILARAFDGLRTGTSSMPLDLVGSVTGLWGDLLVGYGSAYESMGDAGERFLGGVEGVFGERVAAWLREKLTGLVSSFHMEPADLRLRKPVIVNSQTVLDKAGMTSLAKGREILQELPGSPEELVALMRSRVAEELGSGSFTVAELPIPGLEGLSIPLTIDLSTIGATS